MTRTDKLSPQDPAIAALPSLAAACSQDQFQRIERAVLALHPEYERESVQWQAELIHDDQWGGRPNYYGLSQYALLLAMPEPRLSADGLQSLRLWRGKFGDLDNYRDTGPFEALSVDSPIEDDRARFVSDDEWVRIVNGDWKEEGRPWREAKDKKRYIAPTHSNFAFSLERAGKLNPTRYVRLGLRFPPAAEDCYFRSLLRTAALAKRPDDVKDESWVPASIQDIEALFRHIGDKQCIENAEEICRTISQRSGEAWSDATRDLVREYALHHTHPDGKTWPDSEETGDSFRPIETAYLNSVRCSAVRTVAQLLWAHPALFDWAREIAEHVSKDAHPGVRATALELAYALGKHDQDLALQTLLRTYEGTDDAVLAVHHGPYLVRQFWKREKDLTPLLERALNSSDEKVAELAGYWTTVGNILDGLYADLASRAAAGNSAHRVGVVRALVDIAHHYEERRAKSLDRLVPFLNDPDEKVLDTADAIFRHEAFLATDQAPAFAETFASSQAFLRDSTSLLHQLSEYEGSLVPFAGALEASVRHLSGPLASSTQSMAHRNAMAGGDIATILLRLYQQAETAAPALKHRCLDQWDALLKARVGTGQEVLGKLDA